MNWQMLLELTLQCCDPSEREAAPNEVAEMMLVTMMDGAA
jgi:hypothetical protein